MKLHLDLELGGGIVELAATERLFISDAGLVQNLCLGLACCRRRHVHDLPKGAAGQGESKQARTPALEERFHDRCGHAKESDADFKG